MPRYRLLLVDDEPRMTQVLGILADRWGYEVRTASNGDEALRVLQDYPAELIVTDLKMPGLDGAALLDAVKARHPEVAVIIMTAHATVKSAVDAMKAGAYDYIMKPFENEELRLTVERALDYSRLKKDNAYMRRELGAKYRVDKIIGDSPQILDVLKLIERVAPTRATVLVTGESGTGKELVAKAVHFRSGRSTGPFVRVNCAALAETLLESELFGHEKGAFTGAVRTHHGKFEEADGGTIFLDEIGETSNNFQTKLLRVLQEGVLTRVGGMANISVDVRVIAATNRDLQQRVREGRFREDLFFRLNVVPIHLPALRERSSDIPQLAENFIRSAAQANDLPPKQLRDDAVEALKNYDWPGNVRELENTIERAIILSPDRTITAADLWIPSPARADSTPSAAGADAQDAGARYHVPPELFGKPLGPFIDEMAKVRVLHALDQTRWHKQEAADALGIDRATLYRQMKKFGIQESEGEGGKG
ncbi:sigma-54-dependent Fis family transcriptional regulator [Candidatus Sumerlaeota bacterium]|nr:sigma-54-dependent Fis family transcriptional regulator [Candidatus Sumerlaeota bacterium]